MARAFIGLGSNLGEGRTNLLAAWHCLSERGDIRLLALSRPWLTRPIAKPEWLATGRAVGTQYFTNAVGQIESTLSPWELLTRMQEVETALGRNRQQTVDRPVDLDLLYYDDLVLTEATLLLPHPELQNRRFVLVPLAEVAPEHRHPQLGLTSLQMLDELPTAEPGEIEPLAWLTGEPGSNPETTPFAGGA